MAAGVLSGGVDPTLSIPDRLGLPFGDPLVGRLFPPLATGVHWGLERTLGALAALGHPERSFEVVHVGGTNGKGSVATTLSSVLTSWGVRTGCYTSPHLCSFRERITVDGGAVSEGRLIEYADQIREVVVDTGLTFFEAATVLAFFAFSREDVRVAVVEVGLGGRLDSTNVVAPLVTAVTNVAFDHAEYLGDTLPLIATEKAGIMKPGVPFLTTETSPEILQVFRREGEVRGAPVIPVAGQGRIRDVEVGSDHTAFSLRTDVWGDLALRTPLVGRHQAVNAALAVAVLEQLPESLRPDAAGVLEGVARVRHPGRDQVERVDGVTWLFDVAHNTAGVLSLVDTVDRLDLPRPLVALVGVLGDKDWRSMLPPLFSRADLAILTQPPSAPPERRWDAHQAGAEVTPVCPIRVEPDFLRGVEAAREAAGGGTVVVTGSCHTVGDVLLVLGREPLRSV